MLKTRGVARAALTASLVAGVLMGAVASTAGEVIPFDSPRWSLKDGRLVEHLGQKSLVGGADLDDVQLGSGIIEVDLAVTGDRCFPGIGFHKVDDNNLELVYIRPHKSKLDDALQYTPVFNGLGSWQLYSGRGFTSAAEIPWGRWIHVRIEISGARARVFLDHQKAPALVMDDLKFGAIKGGISLQAPASGAAHFANFSVTVTDEVDLGPAPRRGVPTGMLTSWELSRVMSLRAVTRTVAPAFQNLGDLDWLQVSAEPSGLVDIARYRTKAPGSFESVLARTTIHSEREVTKQLTFGYSDEVHVFLNGRLLFSGDSTFTKRDPAFQGIVGLNDALFLPLRQGDNELLLVVTEAMGGWGFLCRIDDVPTAPISTAAGVTPLWDLPAGFAGSESASCDEARDVVYVSNMNMAAAPGSQGGFVSRVTAGGEIREREWVGGLERPTGLFLSGDLLYVVERPGVAVIDVNRGEVVRRLACAAGGMLNDVAVDGQGNVYVSDSRASVIFRITTEGCEPWLTGWPLGNPNGLLVDGDHLVVGNMADSTLRFFRLADRAMTGVIELPKGFVDGVESDGRGGYVISHYDGRILKVASTGQADVVVDTTAAGVPCADITYSPSNGVVYVPTLQGGELMAFKLDTGVSN